MKLNEKIDEYYLMDGFGKTKLQRMIDGFLIKFGGLSQKDYDDFYSVANECFTKAIKCYNGENNFDNYIRSCMVKKLKTEMTRRNRQKRSNVYRHQNGEKVFISDTSLDMPISEDSKTTYGETIEGGMRADQMVEDELSEGVQKFLSSLTETQQKICKCIMDGMTSSEIKQELNLEDGALSKNMEVIKSFKNAHIINKENTNTKIKKETENKNMDNFIEKSCEKHKTTHMAVNEIIRKMNKETIRFDYPGQRESEQWPSIMQSNLISDILQNNHIPALIIAEEVRDGFPTIWNLDGKQRCTTVEAYRRDVFPISKKVKRYLIPYGVRVYDENNKPAKDEMGNPKFEWRECDIRNKRYSQLPDELKDKFNYYQFDAIQYINCSRAEIDYHISRYNEGKAMTKSQKGMSILGYDYAMLTKSISALDFFKEYCNLGRNDRKNGVSERIVLESIMAGYFTESWKKDQNQMFSFVKENCTNETFSEFGEKISDLADIIPDELSEYFTTADTFILLGAYIKSYKMGYSAKDYVKFLENFFENMLDKKINDKSFNDLTEITRSNLESEKKKSTKDSVVVIGKIKLLTALMNEFFGKTDCEDTIGNETDEVGADENAATGKINELGAIFMRSDFAKALKIDDKNIVRKIVDSALEQCHNLDGETFELYLEILNDWSLDVPSDSEMFKTENLPAVIKASMYICEKEMDSDGAKWLVDINSRWAALSHSLKTGEALIADFDGFTRAVSFGQAS